MTEKEREDQAADLFAHRNDPNEWEEEITPAKVRPSGTSVISCRLPSEEFQALEAAAQEAGEKLSEYVRKAIQLRQQHTSTRASFNISYGSQSVQQQDKWSTWTTASSAFIPQDANLPLKKVG